MAEFVFQDISFEGKKDRIRVHFLKLFYFDLDKKELSKIAGFAISKNKISFRGISEARASKKLNFVLSEGFKNLKNKLNGKKTVYIHKNSGIPLIGNGAFGLIDRGTSLIEIKPITSCNLECVYCSVDESKRAVDFVIEKDYLISEFKKLVEFKQMDGIDAHIAAQGEPLLYSPLTELISDLSKIKEVKTISIDTNGILLNERVVDELVKAGLKRFNLSINALEPELAQKIANKAIDIEKIKKICSYIAKKTGLIITPVLIPGVNEEEIPRLIEFSKDIGADIGIQNFLNYRFGKNPVNQMDFGNFYKKLKEWEAKFSVKLIKTAGDFSIEKAKELPKPFKKGEIIKTRIICPGRLRNEKIAVSRGRVITIPNCHEEGIVKARITRTKHNIFLAELICQKYTSGL